MMKVTIDGHEARGALFSVNWPRPGYNGQWCFTCREIDGTRCFVDGQSHDIVINGRSCRAHWPVIRAVPELKGSGPFPFTRVEWSAIADAQ